MTDVASVPPNPALADQIKAIESRFGKEFMAVLVDVVGHVFGATPVGIAVEAAATIAEDVVDSKLPADGQPAVPTGDAADGSTTSGA